MKLQELFSNESKWIKGYQAMREDNSSCHWSDPKAVKFDLGGALFKCYIPTKQYYRILRIVSKELGILKLHDWNDNTTFAELRKLIEKLDI